VPFGGILFVAVQGFFLRLWDARPKRLAGPGLSLALGWAARALVLGGVIAGVLVSSRWKGATAVTAEGHLLPVAAGAVRTLTDVDRDGISSLYGGKDCAPFDGRRSPSAKDVPGNGIDEDCSGYRYWLVYHRPTRDIRPLRHPPDKGDRMSHPPRRIPRRRVVVVVAVAPILVGDGDDGLPLGRGEPGGRCPSPRRFDD
jgi:hypothetical protein